MRIVADADKIAANAAVVVQMCGAHDVEVIGVSKCVRGEPEIVEAMVRGGVGIVGESRLDNIRRIRDAGIRCEVMLLRLPALSEVDDVVELAEYSFNSEAEVVHALSLAAIAAERRHGVLVIVESGDRREGTMPEDAAALCRLVLELPGLYLAGVATNLGCLCGVLSSVESQAAFARQVAQLEDELDYRFPMVSAGNTADMQFLMSGQMPESFTHLRLGEAILFGVDSVRNIELPDAHTDTFTIYAEVIEVKEKPSTPDGEVATDAFMRVHTWPDLGVRRRAVLSMGELDAGVQFMRPSLAGSFVVGASSDHLVLDVTDAALPVRVGDELEFIASYTAVAYGWSSCYASCAVSGVGLSTGVDPVVRTP